MSGRKVKFPVSCRDKMDQFLYGDLKIDFVAILNIRYSKFSSTSKSKLRLKESKAEHFLISLIRAVFTRVI